MKEEFFVYLPPEIIIDILSRLPVQTIICCKCVCKSWLVLIETHEFASSHLSKSALGLAIYESDMNSASIKVFEFDDRLDLERHELHYNQVTKSNLSYDVMIQGSANGLLLLRNPRAESNALYICNPITRDYMELRCPQEFVCTFPQVVTYGFGVSKVTGQHKVVRIFVDCIRDRVTHALLSIPNSECHAYTLGTSSWRSIAPGAPFEYNSRTIGAFFNGNLHWLVSDLKCCPWISCFDLETELFSIFSPPPLPSRERHLAGVFALEDYLCLCDNSSYEEIVIWTMKEYGVEKSWTKEFVINKVPDLAFLSYEAVSPIKVFKDGDILMKWEDHSLFCYSNKTKTIQKIDVFKMHSTGHFSSILHSPSFLSLKSFGVENVFSESSIMANESSKSSVGSPSKSCDQLKVVCTWEKKKRIKKIGKLNEEVENLKKTDDAMEKVTIETTPKEKKNKKQEQIREHEMKKRQTLNEEEKNLKIGDDAMEEVVKETRKEKKYKREEEKILVQKKRTRGKEQQTQDYDGREDRDFLTQCRPQGLHDLVKNLTEKQKDDVESIGFGGLLKISLRSVPITMLKWLVKNFNGTSRILTINPRKSFVITTDDVYDVFLLPRHEGRNVLELSRKENLDIMWELRAKYGIGRKSSLSSLKDLIQDKLKEGGDDFKRFFILYSLSSFLTPTANRLVDLSALKSVVDVDQISKFDWCSYILKRLCKAVDKYNLKVDQKNVSGCVLLLQILYFHRLQWHGKAEPCGLPLIQHWTSEKLRKRVKEETSAGIYGQGEWVNDYPLCLKEKREFEDKESEEKIHQLSENSEAIKTSGLDEPTRFIKFALPCGELNDSEIRKMAKSDIHEASLLLKRDLFVVSNFHLNRMIKMKEKIEQKQSRSSSSEFPDCSESRKFYSDEKVHKYIDEVVECFVSMKKLLEEIHS